MKVLHVFIQYLKTWRGQSRERGQSMVEMALSLPILLLILVGAVEIGMYYNTYMTLVDATREAARYSANGSPTFTDSVTNNSCDSNTGTVDFYKKAACLVMQNLPGVTYDPVRDDIVVSVILIRHGSVYMRFVDAAQTSGEQGWSRCESLPVAGDGGCVRAASRLPNSVIQARLDQFPGASTAPKSAYVLVELYHVHRQFLGLIPPGLAFLPQEVVMHAYSIMPVPSVAGVIPN